MTQGKRSRADYLVDALIESGTWMSRSELHASQAGCSLVALEDALSGLVIEGRADYRENVGYRLAGTPLSRRAMQIAVRERRLRPNQRRFMTPNYFTQDQVRFGFAQVATVNGEEVLIAHEMAFDKARIDGDSINDQAANLIAIAEKFLLGGEAHAGTSI